MFSTVCSNVISNLVSLQDNNTSTMQQNSDKNKKQVFLILTRAILSLFQILFIHDNSILFYITSFFFYHAVFFFFFFFVVVVLLFFFVCLLLLFFFVFFFCCCFVLSCFAKLTYINHTAFLWNSLSIYHKNN